MKFIDGNFCFKLVDPADRLEIINLGYHTAVSEFTGNAMEVTMVVDTLLIKSGRIARYRVLSNKKHLNSYEYSGNEKMG